MFNNLAGEISANVIYIMSEDLFRLCVIRPPLTPEPNLPVIELRNNQSEFQNTLEKTIRDNQDDARTAVFKACQTFLQDKEKVAPLDDKYSINVQIDNTANILTELDGTKEKRKDVVSRLAKIFLAENFPKVDEKHTEAVASAVDILKEAANKAKDTIIALRLLCQERSIGDLAKLARRLRLADNSFKADE